MRLMTTPGIIFATKPNHQKSSNTILLLNTQWLAANESPFSLVRSPLGKLACASLTASHIWKSGLCGYFIWPWSLRFSCTIDFPVKKGPRTWMVFWGGPWLLEPRWVIVFFDIFKALPKYKTGWYSTSKKIAGSPVAPTKFPHHKVNRVARLRRRTRSHWIQRVRWCARRLRCSSPRLAGQTTTAPEPSTRWGYHEKKRDMVS